MTAEVGWKVSSYVLNEGMPTNVHILSVNVPENADCNKLKATSLSYVGYGDLFTKEERGYRIAHWRLADYVDPGPGTDVHVVKNEGCISVTPVGIRLAHDTRATEKMLTKLMRKR